MIGIQNMDTQSIIILIIWIIIMEALFVFYYIALSIIKIVKENNYGYHILFSLICLLTFFLINYLIHLFIENVQRKTKGKKTKRREE